jgi:hypothetical protein
MLLLAHGGVVKRSDEARFFVMVVRAARSLPERAFERVRACKNNFRCRDLANDLPAM